MIFNWSYDVIQEINKYEPVSSLQDDLMIWQFLCIAEPVWPEENQLANINFWTKVADDFLRLKFCVMSDQSNNMTTTDLQYEELSSKNKFVGLWYVFAFCSILYISSTKVCDLSYNSP